MELPITRGRCYLFAGQVLVRSQQVRPNVRIGIPDPNVNGSVDHVLDHSMPTTMGIGADPICYDTSFDGLVEIETEGQGDLVWVQAYEMDADTAARWTEGRRIALAQLHQEQEDSNTEEADAGPGDGGPGDGGPDDGGPGDGGPGDGSPVDDNAGDGGPEGTGDGGVTDAGGEAGTDTGRDIWDADVAPEPLPPPPAIEPPIEAPYGPETFERLDLCADGEDNDGDGRADCSDSDCVQTCLGHRLRRAPWGRIIDLRLGFGMTIHQRGGERQVAQTPLDEQYAPMEMRFALTSAAGAVYRPNRYVGIGLDFTFGYASLRALPPPPHAIDWETRVSMVALTLGPSVHLSYPIWIVEIGATVGMGWRVLRTKGEEVRLTHGSEWQNNPVVDRTFHHGYATGWLWADFWVLDGLAVGMYGGLITLLGPRPELYENDYHVGLRTTLRLSL